MPGAALLEPSHLPYPRTLAQAAGSLGGDRRMADPFHPGQVLGFTASPSGRGKSNKDFLGQIPDFGNMRVVLPQLRIFPVLEMALRAFGGVTCPALFYVEKMSH